MCHFISLIFTEIEKESVYASVLAANHRKLRKIENRSLVKHLKEKEFLVYPEGKSCDCGTALGSFQETEPFRVAKEEIDKMKKRGWTPTKIKRVLEERKRISDRDVRVQQSFNNDMESEGADPDNWVSTISQILEESGSKYVGLLLHWYSGSLDGERIEVQGRKKLNIGDGLGKQLYKMQEDVIYEIYG